jgi:pyridoxamine 5'-phosphate oxidase
MIVETGFDEIIGLFNNGLEREMQVHKQNCLTHAAFLRKGWMGFLMRFCVFKRN